MAEQEEKSKPEGGYGWVIVTACTLLNFMVSVVFVVPGVFLLELAESFQVANAEVVLIGTFSVGATGVFGIFSGVLERQFGCKYLTVICAFIVASGEVVSAFAPNIYTLYITRGCTGGIFAACVGVTTMIPITQYFDKKKGFALSMRTVGTGLGIFLWPPLVQFLIHSYTWRGATMILGGLHLNSIALSLLLTPPPGSARYAGKTKCHCTLKYLFDYTLLKNLSFLFLALAFVTALIGHGTPINFLPSLAKSRGISPSKSAWLVSIIGLCSCIVRPFCGILADKAGKYQAQIFAITVIITGSLVVVQSQLYRFTVFAVVSGAIGVFNSNYLVLFPTLLSEVVPARQISTALGLTGTILAAVALGTNSLAGWMVDATKSFATPFLAYGCVQMSSSLLIGVVVLLQRRQKKKGETKENTELNEEKEILNSKNNSPNV